MMNSLSAHVRRTLVLILALSGLTHAGQSWPLKGTVDLSSGFGDFRDGRFHAGLDLRTGGRSGATVLSPVDGYVWRVSMSYYGYGKGLYIMGDDGFLYVFGHLSEMAGPIAKAVKQEQLAQRRYFVDVKFPKDSLRFKKGDFVAYSGQTGVGAPHLHFEKRTTDNIPLNPLLHGFELTDAIAPTLSRLGFAMQDDRSLFTNGRRDFFLELPGDPAARTFRLDTILYFQRPFGVLVEGFDQMRSAGMKQAVYHYALYIDDKQYYSVHLDSLDYDDAASANVEYDYVQAVRDKAPVRRLYKLPDDRFRGSKGIGEHGGVFGAVGNERRGKHSARIAASDVSGNQTELTFDFFWGPPEYIFHLDSSRTASADSTWFYFTPIAEWREYGIDSVVSLRNVADSWGPPRNLYNYFGADGSYRCLVVGERVGGTVLRLFLYTSGGVIADNLFHGVNKEQPDRIRINYEIVDDGLLINLALGHKTGSESRVELYHGDSLLGVEYPQFFHMEQHICFVPPRPQYRRVDRIGAAATRDAAHKVTLFSDTVAIFAVGFDDEQKVSVDEFFTARFDRADFYKPRFVELRRNRPKEASLIGLSSAHYQILPEQFVTREPFDIELRVTNRNISQIASGLCRLDKARDRWVWLSRDNESAVLKANSTGGGSFAAVNDPNPPAISKLNITDGRTYYDAVPVIRFLAEDAVSGIEDDRNIYIKLDGQWLIPEYDPESRLCVTAPNAPLAEGKHHLEITVTDRAGLKAESFVNFYTRSKPAVGGRRRP